jgi:hypothetical protein
MRRRLVYMTGVVALLSFALRPPVSAAANTKGVPPVISMEGAAPNYGHRWAETTTIKDRGVAIAGTGQASAVSAIRSIIARLLRNRKINLLHERVYYFLSIQRPRWVILHEELARRGQSGALHLPKMA